MFFSLPRSGDFKKKQLLFLEFAAKRAKMWVIFGVFRREAPVFMEVIFGVFESLDLWSSNILSSETHKIEREIASETLYMDFFAAARHF